MKRRVSVIIVNYNGERYIKKLFLSLGRQSFRDFEVIFVDNASTDNSIKTLNKIIRGASFKDVRVKTVLSKQNLGFCRGNNLGLRYAQGKYIVFLNNDTFVEQRWLEELVKALDSDLMIGVCQSKELLPESGRLYSLGDLCDRYGSAGYRYYSPKEKKNNLLVDTFFYAGGMSTIFRRDALDRCEGFDEELFYGDCDICWRLRLLGYKIATAPRSVFYHYIGKATEMVLSHMMLTYHSHRETIRILIKNYSVSRVAMRLPITITLRLVESAILSIWFRKPYLAIFFKAIFWNLSKIKDTLKERVRIQETREVSDIEIERYMIPFSYLIYKNRLYEK